MIFMLPCDILHFAVEKKGEKKLCRMMHNSSMILIFIPDKRKNTLFF